MNVREWIEFERAFKILKAFLEKFGKSIDDDKIEDILKKLDNPKKEAFTIKEIRESGRHLLGKREINFEDAKIEREHYIEKLKKIEKRRQDQKERKKKEKLNRELTDQNDSSGEDSDSDVFEED